MAVTHVTSHKTATVGANCVKFTEDRQILFSDKKCSPGGIVLTTYGLRGTTRAISAIVELLVYILLSDRGMRVWFTR